MPADSLLVALALGLVLLNAFFVAAEFAVVRVRPTRVEALAEEGHSQARVVRGLQARMETFLSATQLGITLTSLALGWVGEPAFAHILCGVFSALGMAFLNENKYDLAIPPLQQSAQLDSNRWDTHYALAKAFYYQQQFDNALKESQLAISQSHGAEPAIELLIAQSQTAVGKYEDSAETLRTFLRTHPGDKGVATARRWLDRLVADGKVRK